ncbi:MAG: hypothetical protein KGH60_03380 [Candidatus Micrarchaeota archaeon]|nr:hypothetical protein [Candidatus Micrarchaeota archaeon]
MSKGHEMTPLGAIIVGIVATGVSSQVLSAPLVWVITVIGVVLIIAGIYGFIKGKKHIS